MINQMTTRLYAQKTLDGAIRRILDDVIALHGAEFGDITLVVDGHLELVAHRGFRISDLLRLRVEGHEGTACAQAYRARRPVIIHDVRENEEFAPFVELAARIGFRSVQSTPLITSQAECVGVVSTHFANIHSPTAIEMDALAKYSRVAADYIRELIGSESVAECSKRLFQTVTQQANVTAL
jgi:GAF domain-containing protein